MKKLLVIGSLVLVCAFIVAVSSIKADEEEITTSSGPLYIILNSYCKDSVVEYTKWSDCDKRFGPKGFQYRSIIRPTLGDCNPSAAQQAAQQRECK